MSATDFDSLYQLIFNAGLVICFGLGVISGGQRWVHYLTSLLLIVLDGLYPILFWCL